jgi:hypothetical protein
MKVELEDGAMIDCPNLVHDGINPEKPFFYSFIMADRSMSEYPLDRIRGLYYGPDKAEYMDYWRKREQEAKG